MKVRCVSCLALMDEDGPVIGGVFSHEAAGVCDDCHQKYGEQKHGAKPRPKATGQFQSLPQLQMLHAANPGR